jgi:hypothetical protein
MPTNDSTTGGILLPTDVTAPAYDAELDAVFQQLVTGLTGLPGSLVRPRWQATQPKQPEASQNWVAIGATSIESDGWGAVIAHNDSGSGNDSVTRWEILTVLVSAYGPAAMRYASQIRDGLFLPQNAEFLRANDMGMIDSDQIRTLPNLVNQVYRHRYDIQFRLRRKATRTYAIRNLAAVEIDLHTANPETETIIPLDLE